VLGHFRRTYGYEPRVRVLALLAPALEAALGIAPVDGDAMAVRFAARAGAFVRSVVVRVERPLAGPVLDVQLILHEVREGSPDRYLTATELTNDGAPWPAASRAEVDASLGAIAARIAAEGARKFAERERRSAGRR